MRGRTWCRKPRHRGRGEIATRRPPILRTAGVATLALAMVSTPARAGGPRVGPQGGGPSVATAVVRTAGTVTGVVWQRDNQPLKRAPLRLRHSDNGQVVAVARADDEGRFAFSSVPPGRYLVELVDERDRVRAVSPMFGVGADESVATVVRLGTDAPWYGGFFKSAALAALATAATLGVTARGDGQPASARF